MSQLTFLLLGLEKDKLQEHLKVILPASVTYSLIQEFSLFRLNVTLPGAKEQEELISALKNTLSDHIIAINQTNLAIVVGEYLRKRGETISTAESCTAGKIAAWLADIPGSSSYLMEGVVVYSNQAKTRLCGVAPEMIVEYGAVSSQVAIALSEGILSYSGTDWALSVTGIAGPGGGSAQKPVGTVHISCSSKYGTKERRFIFSGNRLEVREQTATQALVLLLENILEIDRDTSREL